MKIGIITQARFGSTRLPGKILKTARGKTLLQYHLDRLRKTGLEVVVATSTLPQEQPILDLCAGLGVPTVRGSESDVLSRYHEAWKQHQFDLMVRVTSDCPLIDPILVSEGVREHQELSRKLPEGFHLYYSNSIERTYSRGFDFEVFDAAMLNEAMEKGTSPSEREHVTPYFYLNKSPNIKVMQKKQAVDHSELRITVDEADDYELVKRLIEDFDADQLGYARIEEILLAHPELRKINEHVAQKKT